jgi:hypothetical protein
VHFFAVVVIPPDSADVHEAVVELMKPYDEEATSDGEGFWDWWQIGGRWTGVFAEYDPVQDPENWETCFICGGTSYRIDEIGNRTRLEDPHFTCNGCNDPTTPPGVAVKWPTQWRRYEGDILPVRHAVRLPRVPRTLVTPEGAQHKETWNGKGFDKDPDWENTYRRTLDKFMDFTAVVVDYHD